MEPIIDHIEITVREMSVAVRFYDKLLPLLGFDLESRNSAVLDDHELHVVEYLHPRLGFAISSPRSAFRGDAVNRRRPGALHHLAFRAESRTEVDRLHLELKKIGGLWLAGRVEKIREVVCSLGGHVPIRGAWPGRAAGVTVRGRPGENRIRGRSASRSFSGRTPS